MITTIVAAVLISLGLAVGIGGPVVTKAKVFFKKEEAKFEKELKKDSLEFLKDIEDEIEENSKA